MGLVALGVSGGIGAYKAVEIVRGLQDEGHSVVAILTRGALRFVGELTFEAITKRRVITDQFAPGSNADIEHISLASDIDALLIAPATANVIGKLANGVADDFLTTLYLATRAPTLIAPAMNTNMLEHKAVVANLATLKERGVEVLPTGDGHLACGWVGLGRLAEPTEVVAAVGSLLISTQEDLVGRSVVVSAGPTYEDVDPVRFIGNRSSGRMGLAVAAEAVSRGARVALVLGPCNLTPPAGVEVLRVRSSDEMRTEVLHHAQKADAVIMAAAVADYRVEGGPQKMKLAKSEERLTLTLTRNADILVELGRRRGSQAQPVLIGFAAETKDVIQRAREKLRTKKVDLVVANDVSRADAGFEVETNAATLIDDTSATEVPLCSKRDLARVILDRVGQLLSQRLPLTQDETVDSNDPS